LIKFENIKSPNSSYVNNINSVIPKQNNRRASSCEQTKTTESESMLLNIEDYKYSIYDIKQNRNSVSNIPKLIRKTKTGNTLNNSTPLTTSHFTTANYDISSSNISDNERYYRNMFSELNKENSDLFQKQNFDLKGSSMPNPTTNSFNRHSSHIKIRSCIPRLSQSCNLITNNIIPTDLITTNEISSFNPKLNSTSKNQLIDSRAPSCLVTSSIFNNELEKSINLNTSIGTDTSKLVKSMVDNNNDDLDLSNNILNASNSSSQYI
jgi:hypothetical protein